MAASKKRVGLIAGGAAAVVAAAAFVVSSVGGGPLKGTIDVTWSKGQCGSGACWTCKGRVDLDKVTVRVDARDSRVDAVKLAKGCTGEIRGLYVATISGDGVKVAEGAHDLVVTGGSILCSGRVGAVHQDGIQVLGGARITFRMMFVRCPIAKPKKGDLSHSAFFVSTAGTSKTTTSAVVFEDGFLGSAGTTVDVATSDASGVRRSTVCPSTTIGKAVYVPVLPHKMPTATRVVNVGNVFPPSC